MVSLLFQTRLPSFKVAQTISLDGLIQISMARSCPHSTLSPISEKKTWQLRIRFALVQFQEKNVCFVLFDLFQSLNNQKVISFLADIVTLNAVGMYFIVEI
ncbi:hypothetical protein Tco_0949291 [Tanacetum coccineum]